MTLSGPLETIRCNLCDRDETQLLATRSRFEIPLNTVICKHCGLIYHNPRMSLEGFAKFYIHDYRQLIESETQSAAELFQAQIKHGERIRNWLGADMPNNGTILDIGSGPGGQLWVMQEKFGVQGIGVEPAVEHAEWARATHGLDIRAGMLEDFEFEANTFDVVLISQTLNHLLDPLGTLQRVHSLLKPDGKIYLEVIDFVYWTRLSPLTMATTIDHPYMFAQETLRAMMSQAGFKILKWEADSDTPSRKREPGQPNLHMRALGVKSEKSLPTVYPNFQTILNQIKANQRAYRYQAQRFWAYSQLDRAKGWTRNLLGERSWNALKKVTGKERV